MRNRQDRIFLWALEDMRLYVFLFAVSLYAIFGSPTPDYFGIVEIVIALCLVIAVGVPGLMQVFRPLNVPHAWQVSLQAFFIFGCSVPVLVAVISGNNISLAVRDIIAFLFLCLPGLLFPLFLGWGRRVKYLIIAVIFLGFMFSLRALVQIYHEPLIFLRFLSLPDLAYFANMPSVLFSALFLGGLGVYRFLVQFSLRSGARMVLFCLISCLIFLPIVVTLQRASIGYAALYFSFFIGVGFYLYALRMLVVLIPLALGFVFLLSPLSDVLSLLFVKTTQVGFNHRIEEWVRVWEEVSQTPLTLIFGAGWGADFVSPAVSGARVNFTHSFFSHILLKAGLVGVVLAMFYMVSIGRVLSQNFFRQPILAFALLGPFLIDVFLYASFKSFDFGLILLLGVVSMEASSTQGQKQRE